jgi:hypothetical protein
MSISMGPTDPPAAPTRRGIETSASPTSGSTLSPGRVPRHIWDSSPETDALWQGVCDRIAEVYPAVRDARFAGVVYDGEAYYNGAGPAPAAGSAPSPWLWGHDEEAGSEGNYYRRGLQIGRAIHAAWPEVTLPCMANNSAGTKLGAASICHAPAVRVNAAYLIVRLGMNGRCGSDQVNFSQRVPTQTETRKHRLVRCGRSRSSARRIIRCPDNGFAHVWPAC